MSEDNTFSSWCILELMGHRRLGGYVTEAEVGGIPFLRIKVHRADGSQFDQFYGKAAVYAMTPTTEEIARAVSRAAEGPVSRWELPAQLVAGGEAPTMPDTDYDPTDEIGHNEVLEDFDREEYPALDDVPVAQPGDLS